jgi:predicted GIY-YIG superfamily endonuclease
MTTALYRHYDRDGILLYVGITDDMTRRSKEHARDKEWWSRVEDTRVQYVESRKHAEALERVAILYEKPAYNKPLGPKRIKKRQHEQVPALVANEVLTDEERKLAKLFDSLDHDQQKGILLLARTLLATRDVVPLEVFKNIPPERFVEAARKPRSQRGAA